jgi:hypothetical protein
MYIAEGEKDGLWLTGELDRIVVKLTGHGARLR